MSKPRNPAPHGYEHTGGAYRFLVYPNGTGTPTVQGAGVSSAVRSDTGTILVTLLDAHYKMTYFSPVLSASGTGSNNRAQGGTVSNLGTDTPTTLTIFTRSATANVDISASANDFISVEAVFDDSAVVLD